MVIVRIALLGALLRRLSKAVESVGEGSGGLPLSALQSAASEGRIHVFPE